MKTKCPACGVEGCTWFEDMARYQLMKRREMGLRY